MKKILALVAVLSLCFAFTACGNKDIASFEGQTYSAQSPWGGTLEVTIDKVDGNKILWTYHEVVKDQEELEFILQTTTKLSNGSGNFELGGGTDLAILDYTGTITLADDTVTITYADGQKTAASENGGEGFEMVGALDDDSKVVTLSSSSDSPTTTEESTEASEESSDSDGNESSDADSSEIHPLVINTEAVNVMATDLDDRGYAGFTVDATDAYSFSAMNSGDATWSVYVMDKKFDDATRYIAEEYEPALEGDGTLDLTAGQYIYVYCSANTFTTDEIPADAALSIYFAE